MSLSRIPMPSIAFVLALERAPIPSRPSVIKFEFDPLQTIYPIPSDPVLDLNGIPNDSTGGQTDQSDNVPVVVDTFFSLVNDSSTDVSLSDHGQLDDGSAAQTSFTEKKSTSQGGLRLKGLTGDVTLKGNFMALTSSIRSLLLQFKLKGSPANETAEVDE